MVGDTVRKSIAKRPRFSEWTWLAVSLMMMAYVAGAAIPVTYWIKVHSIQVSDGLTPEDVQVRVDREIFHTFDGSYSVEIRDTFGWHVCTVPSRDFELRYRVRARNEGLSPEGWVSLAYWMGGEQWLEACKLAGFGPGQYRLTTCHVVEHPFEFLGYQPYPPREECWPASNLFRIGPPA